MKRLRLFLLGGLDGVLYSALMLVLVWQMRAYEYSRNAEDLPVQLTSNERWVPMVVIWIVMFGLAALLVDYFWRRHHQAVLFWEAIGLVAVAGWNVFILLAFSLEQGFSSTTMSYAWVTSPSNPFFGPTSLGVVLLVNLLYAQAVWLFERRTVRS